MDAKPSDDEAVDRMGEHSFPASDPPDTTPPPGTRVAEQQVQADDAGVAGEAAPKGQPTDDRYHQETAAARHHGVQPPERDKRSGARH